MAWLKRVKLLLYPVTSRYLSTAIHACGVLRGTGQPFQCLFVDNSLFAQYLLPKMFDGPVRIKRKWKIWLPALPRFLRSQRGSLDLCVAVVPARYDSRFEGLCLARTREFVVQDIDTTRPWQEITRQFHKNKKEELSRRASTHGIDYRISHDPQDLEFFYRRMYVPSAGKFIASARISSLDSMKARLASGFLVFVTQQGEAVAGGLCTLEDARLVFRWMGVLEGDERHVKSGAQMATYFAVLQIAKQRDCRALDLQRSRPLLTDGVYFTKRSWGASVRPDPESEESWVYFFDVGGSALLPRFFESNPVIVHAGKGLRGIVGQPDLDDCVPPSRAKELIRRYRSPGLAGLTVMTGTGRLVELEG